MRKTLISLLLAAFVGSTAAFAEGLDFNINVEGTTAIAVDKAYSGGQKEIEDLDVSYVLNSDLPLVFDGTSEFQLRYITNKVLADASITQDNCWFDAGVEGDEDCGPDNTESAQQFSSAYITVKAGRVDGGDVVSVPEFADTLSLKLTSDACVTSALANDFSYSNLPAYDIDNGGRTVPGVEFSTLQANRAVAQLGQSQATTGLAVAFDAVEVNLIGAADDQYMASYIRGAACGLGSTEGMPVTVEPVINTDKLLPAGTTPVQLVITIYDDSI